MALNEDGRSRSDTLDRVLSEEVDGYEPPSDEEMKRWLDSAPHPAEAVDYDATETGHRVDE